MFDCTGLRDAWKKAVSAAGYSGTTPSVSSTGTNNGIGWALDTSSHCISGAKTCGSVVLHAYDATNLGKKLSNSSMVGADAGGNAVKFAVATIATVGYEECRKSKPERTLEIGLGYGFSTLFFSAALAKNNFGHHSAIDPYQRSAWQGSGLTTANALASPGRFRFVEETSVRAAVELERESSAYGLIFVDGGHIFEQVLVDFFLYAKLCKICGLVIFDDMWMSSIKTVASFIRTNRKDFSEIPTPIPNLCVFQRVGNDERK